MQKYGREHILILAGGRGTRMSGEKPKALQNLNGKSLLRRVVSNVRPVCPHPSIVVGYGADEVMHEMGDDFFYIHQEAQRGTGHAVQCAKEALENEPIETLVVLLSDQPLVSAATIKRCLERHNVQKAAVTFSTVIAPHFEKPYTAFFHYGRVVRDERGRVVKIVEFRDATDEERMIKEVNVSVMCFDTHWLWKNIDRLQNDNGANEYYLTDMIALALHDGQKVETYCMEHPEEALGANTAEDLRILEEVTENREE